MELTPIDFSPHCEQLKNYNKKFSYSRICNLKNKPIACYHQEKNSCKTLAHYGQLKLLISEIEFLNKIINIDKNIENILIIYIGAAPGIHIKLLYEMFPNFEYILIDPDKFSEDIINLSKTNNNINIINKLFYEKETEELKKEYSNKNIYLISDIRAFSENNYENMGNWEIQTKREEDIIENNKLQMKFYDLLKPKLSMFKMRLPFYKEITEIKTIKFLEGEIYYQAYAGPRSTETRIIVQENAKIINYDCELYENNLFSFNYYIRPNFYPNRFTFKEFFIDNCYDCYTFTKILEEYCLIFPDKKMELDDQIKYFIIKINNYLKISEKKLLLTKNGIKYKVFVKNLF